MEKVITCESVFRGHPDKVCDQISDAILDACLKQDKNSRVAIECAIKDNEVWLFGEITTKAIVDYSLITKRVLLDIGYKENFNIRESISKQSDDIALGVDKEGAGDQGMMYGYAEENNYGYMPVPLMLAHDIGKKIDSLRKTKYPHLFGADGKCQVSTTYQDDKLTRINTIVVSAQTLEGVSVEDIKPIIINEVLGNLLNDIEGIKILINPTGAFVKGGPYADSGLTGRKIIVDTYGGVAHHGGGAFSGKDPSKVDRSAAYYCRYVAKSIVVAGLAKRCEVGVSYSIGVAEPVSISINTFGTATITEEQIKELILKHFDFKPKSIIEELHLKDVNYEALASYGHIGREELNVPWECVDEKAKILRSI
jgi:S-adenosylmethionine synthetase